MKTFILTHIGFADKIAATLLRGYAVKQAPLIINAIASIGILNIIV